MDPFFKVGRFALCKVSEDLYIVVLPASMKYNHPSVSMKRWIYRWLDMSPDSGLFFRYFAFYVRREHVFSVYRYFYSHGLILHERPEGLEDFFGFLEKHQSALFSLVRREEFEEVHSDGSPHGPPVFQPIRFSALALLPRAPGQARYLHAQPPETSAAAAAHTGTRTDGQNQ